MCGIAGILDTRDRREVDVQLLRHMGEALAHRGPDGDGMHVEPGVGLAHRRLSIIDVTGGAQPLGNEDGSVVVTYNGEIYNFLELRVELIALGHVFKTRSDTEVLVHGWEEWGKDLLPRLRGMFAFALWDARERLLLLARDPLGIKPLYYALLPGGWLIFASELKGLLVHRALSRDLDATAIEDYFTFGYVPDPKSILRAVSKLAPGCYAVVAPNATQVRPQRYWQLRFEPVYDRPMAILEDELIGRLRDSVKSQLISDVPIGAFLSGGVDSSAVVALMAGLMSEPVRTRSISFGESGYDESPYARRIAQRYGTMHRERRVDPNDFALVASLANIYDEPFADSSAIPTYRVCQLARESIKVVLSGDGGDENFAGYRRYRWQASLDPIRKWIPQLIRGSVFALAASCYPKLDWAPRPLRAKATLQALSLPSLDGYMHIISIMRGAQRAALYSPEFRQSLAGYSAIEVFKRHAADAPQEPLARAQYLDFMTYLPGGILTKVDRASMAHGLEVRVPLLDHRFVEWAASVPSRLKLQGTQGKIILKRALAPLVDADVLYRPKMGFAVPLREWFRGPLRHHIEELPDDMLMRDTGMFNRNMMRTLVRQHVSGQRNYTAPIWSLLMFRGSLQRLAAHE